MRRTANTKRAERIEAETYKAAGYSEKPAGIAWINAVLDIAKEYMRQDMTFTFGDLGQLSEDRASAAYQAAEIVMRLKNKEEPLSL